MLLVYKRCVDGGARHVVVVPLILATNESISAGIKEVMVKLHHKFPAITFHVMKPLSLLDAFMDFVQKTIATEAQNRFVVAMPQASHYELNATALSDSLIFSTHDENLYSPLILDGEEASMDKKVRL